MEAVDVMSVLKDAYKGRRVLVTGDTGFKGSWLAIWLTYLGADVQGYALPPKSEDDNFSICRIHQKIHHTDGDIRDDEQLTSVFDSFRPEVVFHLAAQALVLPSYANPVETFDTNVMGTVRVLEAVRQTPSVRAVVNITSDKCYDNREWVWGYRESDPMGGKDPYSASKGCAELVTAAYRHSFFSSPNSPLVATARAGNVIGGGDWGECRLIADIFRGWRQGQEVLIRNPKSTRPWQFVLEPLRGYLELGRRLLAGDPICADAWNFGPDGLESRTVQQVVDALIRKLGSGTYRIEESGGALHEANTLSLDISKAQYRLGWKPILTFEQIINMTVDGYRAEGDIFLARIRQIEQYMAICP